MLGLIGDPDLSYITQYHAPMRGIALPHNLSLAILPEHMGLQTKDMMLGIMLFLENNRSHFLSLHFYVSWYQMIDPAASPLRSDWNLKTFDWSSGGSPYAMNSCVNNSGILTMPTGVPLTTSTSSAQHQLNDDSWGYAGCGEVCKTLMSMDIAHSGGYQGKKPIKLLDKDGIGD